MTVSLRFLFHRNEFLQFSYDHELKIQRAQENVRRTEKEKEIERYADLITDLQDQSNAEERRQSELRRRITKLHHSRQLYETLQAKNYEQSVKKRCCFFFFNEFCVC